MTTTIKRKPHTDGFNAWLFGQRGEVFDRAPEYILILTDVAHHVTAADDRLLVSCSRDYEDAIAPLLGDFTAGLPIGKKRLNVQSPQKTRPSAELRTEKLTTIQSAFGLPIKTLASILGISRPQLYKWMDPTLDIAPQLEKNRRLSDIESLAEDWSALSDAPLELVSRETLPNGVTIIDLLSAPVINRQEIAAAYTDLTGRLNRKPKTASQKMRQAGFKKRPSAKALPPDE